MTTSVAEALRATEAAAGVAVMPAGTFEVSVTVPLNPFTGVSARVLVPDLAGTITTSALCVVSEKSDCATATLTALDEAAL